MTASVNNRIANPKVSIMGITHVARASSVQAVANNTAVAISWDTVVSDSLGTYSAGAPTRITVPQGATHCVVVGHCEWTINGTGYRSLRLNINGSAAANPQYSPTDVRMPNGSISDHNHCASALMPVDAGDYFEFMARQLSTISLDILTANTRCIVEWYSLNI